MAFEVKEKRPKLSTEMQNIIERSHHESDSECYDDIDTYKFKIMKMLTSNQDILWTLHNKELEITDIDGNINGDAYRFVNIYNFMKIPDIQSTVKNFILFDVDDTEQPRYNDNLIIRHIIFRTISHDDDYKTDWGIARQDLLAAIIKSEFDWTNVFGMHLEKVSDRGKVFENGYYYRELIYETTVPNNTANKLKNGGTNYYGRSV